MGDENNGYIILFAIIYIIVMLIFIGLAIYDGYELANYDSRPMPNVSPDPNLNKEKYEQDRSDIKSDLILMGGLGGTMALLLGVGIYKFYDRYKEYLKNNSTN